MTDCAALVVDRLRLRQRHNTRYSLRAFARDLGVSHSTLSGVVRRRRPASATFVRQIAARLGLEGPVVDRLVAVEHERKLAAQVRQPDFRPDLRDVAVRSGLPVDVLCVALHHMLADGRLEMTTSATWTLRGSP